MASIVPGSLVEGFDPAMLENILGGGLLSTTGAAGTIGGGLLSTTGAAGTRGISSLNLYNQPTGEDNWGNPAAATPYAGEIPDWIKNLNLPETYTESYFESGDPWAQTRQSPANYYTGSNFTDLLTGQSGMAYITGPEGKIYNPNYFNPVSNDYGALQARVDALNESIGATSESEQYAIFPNWKGNDPMSGEYDPGGQWKIEYAGVGSPWIHEAIRKYGETIVIAAIATMGTLGAANALGFSIPGAAGTAGNVAGEMGGSTIGLGAGEVAAGTGAGITGAGNIGAELGGIGPTGTIGAETGISLGAGGAAEAGLTVGGAETGIGLETGAGITGAGAGIEAASPAGLFSSLTPTQWTMLAAGGIGALSDAVSNYLGAEASEEAMEEYLKAWYSAQWTDARREAYISSATNAITQYGAQQAAARGPQIAAEMAARGTGGGTYAGSVEREQDKINAMVANNINSAVLETYKPPASTPNVQAFFQGNQNPWAETLEGFGSAIGSALPWWMMSNIYSNSKP
uniref:Uncharacterized protein n=2 Tax=viral metagenome TaxID=1070528 RepID=A0A6M3IIT2_9ZZZZ